MGLAPDRRDQNGIMILGSGVIMLFAGPPNLSDVHSHGVPKAILRQRLLTWASTRGAAPGLVGAVEGGRQCTNTSVSNSGGSWRIGESSSLLSETPPFSSHQLSCRAEIWPSKSRMTSHSPRRSTPSISTPSVRLSNIRPIVESRAAMSRSSASSTTSDCLISRRCAASGAKSGPWAWRLCNEVEVGPVCDIVNDRLRGQ
jgi:hypothetical protein